MHGINEDHGRQVGWSQGINILLTNKRSGGVHPRMGYIDSRYIDSRYIDSRYIDSSSGHISL